MPVACAYLPGYDCRCDDPKDCPIIHKPPGAFPLRIPPDKAAAAARAAAARWARAISAHHRIQCPGKLTHLEMRPGGAVRVPGCGCPRERLLFTELHRAHAEGWPADADTA